MKLKPIEREYNSLLQTEYFYEARIRTLEALTNKLIQYIEDIAVETGTTEAIEALNKVREYNSDFQF